MTQPLRPLISAFLPVALAAALALPAAGQTKPATPAPAPAPAAPAPAGAPQTIDVPPPVAVLVEGLTHGQAKILKAFKAPGGLVGLAVSAGPNRNIILYATPDGSALIQGTMVSAGGQNLTKAADAAFLPQPPTAADNFATLDKTHGFVWGDAAAKKELWILFDPNCIFCHKTFMALEKPVADGKLKVHIIMAGFLKKSSLGKAAAILSAKDPVAALTEDETKFNTDQEEGGIAPDTSNAAAVDQVKANNAWMEAQQIGGTPYMLYRDASGQVQGIAGYIDNIDGLIGDIGTSG